MSIYLVLCWLYPQTLLNWSRYFQLKWKIKLEAEFEEKCKNFSHLRKFQTLWRTVEILVANYSSASCTNCHRDIFFSSWLNNNIWVKFWRHPDIGLLIKNPMKESAFLKLTLSSLAPADDDREALTPSCCKSSTRSSISVPRSSGECFRTPVARSFEPLSSSSKAWKHAACRVNTNQRWSGLLKHHCHLQQSSLFVIPSLENQFLYRVSQKTPKTIENDLLLEFQCLALNWTHEWINYWHNRHNINSITQC